MYYYFVSDTLGTYEFSVILDFFFNLINNIFLVVVNVEPIA
jgi:hypothetical protein